MVQIGAQARQIKPATAGFIAAGKARDLDMIDIVLVALPNLRRIAMNTRGMPQIKLDTDVQNRKIIQNPARLIEIVQKISRHVIGVQRLDAKILVRRLRSRPSQVVNIGLFG